MIMRTVKFLQLPLYNTLYYNILDDIAEDIKNELRVVFAAIDSARKPPDK